MSMVALPSRGQEEQSEDLTPEDIIPDSAASSPQQHTLAVSTSPELSDPETPSQCTVRPDMSALNDLSNPNSRAPTLTGGETASEDDTASAKADYCPARNKQGTAEQATERKAATTKKSAQRNKVAPTKRSVTKKQPTKQAQPSKARPHPKSVQSLTETDEGVNRTMIKIRTPSNKRAARPTEDLEASPTSSKRRRPVTLSSGEPITVLPPLVTPVQSTPGDEQLSACLVGFLTAQTALRGEAADKDRKFKELEERLSQADRRVRLKTEKKKKLFDEYSKLQQTVRNDAQQYEKVTDDWIVNYWNRLAFDIENVTTWMRSELNVREKPSADTAHTEAMADILQYCALPNKKITKKHGKIQRFTWDRIVQGVFSPKQEIWCDQVAQEYAPLNSTLSEQALKDPRSRKQCSKIKPWLAHEMDRLCPVSPDAITDFASALTRDLSIFCDHEQVQGLSEEMLAITRRAVELWAVLRKSRAFFCVCSDPFDPRESRQDPDMDTMEVFSTIASRPPSERGVWFVQSPYLIKCGGADGFEEDFAEVMILCKARVVLL